VREFDETRWARLTSMAHADHESSRFTAGGDIHMANRTHTDDFRDVMHAAEEALTAALQDGQHKYEAGDWLAHSMEDHLDHAGAHLEELLNTEELTEEKLRTGLSHLICRAVMAWARREQG
jgi:hypothetical protein